MAFQMKKPPLASKSFHTLRQFHHDVTPDSSRQTLSLMAKPCLSRISQATGVCNQAVAEDAAFGDIVVHKDSHGLETLEAFSRQSQALLDTNSAVNIRIPEWLDQTSQRQTEAAVDLQIAFISFLKITVLALVLIFMMVLKLGLDLYFFLDLNEGSSDKDPDQKFTVPEQVLPPHNDTPKASTSSEI